MSTHIIERNHVKLTPVKEKMIKSGWGESTIKDTTVESITYESDGLKVKGYIAYPNDDTKKYPCIIWCRGGIGNSGAIDEFNARGIFGSLASWGYVVLASQYRGNAGGEGHDEFGGGDVNDVLNLIHIADEIPQADTSVWGIEGWSRGGMMTYLTLTRDDRFKAAVITGGIANLRCNADESTFMRKLYERTMGKHGSGDFNKKCESRSIVNFADELPDTPILMMHGTNDDRVLPHDSLDLSYKLLDNKKPFRLIMLEGGDHFLKTHRNDVNAQRKEWFDRYLKNE